ncbi:MAG: sugar phosphate nucleotidyltransferase [Candidatus Hodarchaeota archaeon]
MEGAKSDIYVIILAAGYATRLRPLSNRIPKPLINICGKPIISRIISNFKDSGFTRFCILIGYKQELIRKEILKNKDIQIEFVEQKELTGMAEAISLSINHLNQKNENIKGFFVTAGDIIPQREDIIKLYSLYLNSKADMILSLMVSYDIEIASGHGNVKISKYSKLDDDTNLNHGLKIIDIIEKPKSHQILSDYYSLPFYFFNQKIVKNLENIKISERGEKEFQGAIKNAIISGDDVRGIRILDTQITKDNIGKFHLTKLKDIIDMNNKFLYGVNLEKFKGKAPEFFEPVKISFGVEIGSKVVLGPYVTIGKFCRIGDFCELADVIIFDNTKIGKACKLNWCIIDENVNLPDNFLAKDCFITQNDKKELDIINF